jgi:hypothetical protein
MTSRNDLRMAPPQQVYDSYKEIRNSELIRNKVLSDKNIECFQLSLNNAQPLSDEESKTRSLIQYLYRKNPTNFCRFLVRSKLNHLILWTEAKCIVRHFGLMGIVYVKWNNNSYECSLHTHADGNLQEPDLEHPSAHRTYKSVEENYKYDNRSHSNSTRYQRNKIHGDGYVDRGDRGQSYNYRGGNSQSYSNSLPTNTVDKFPQLPTRPVVQETCEHLSQSSDLTASVSEFVL